MRYLAGLLLLSMVAGCSADSSCWCEGEELDFSVVGDLAGVWAGDGIAVHFDADHRPRRFERGSYSYAFGCDPLEYPLIRGAETSAKLGLDVVTHHLVESQVEPGRFELEWGGEGESLTLVAQLDGDQLVVEGSVNPTPCSRTDDSPAETPPELDRCD